MGNIRQFRRSLSPQLSHKRRIPLFRTGKKVLTFLGSNIWKIFSGAVVVLGFVSYFSPKVLVYPLDFDGGPQGILTPFVIHNDSNTSIDKVSFITSLNSIHFINEVQDNNPLRNSRLAIQKRIPKIFAHDKYTVRELIHSNPGASFDSADISVVIDYNISFLPFRMKDVFSFSTHTDSSGKVSWYPQPVEESMNRYNPFSIFFKR